MPNIRTYENPIDVIRPEETGPETLARAARVIGAEYNQMGQQIGGAVSQVGGQVADAIHAHDVQAETTDIGNKIIAAKMQTDQEQAELNKRQLNPESFIDPNLTGPARAQAIADVQRQATQDQAEYNEKTLEPRMQSIRDSAHTKEGQAFTQAHLERWATEHGNKQIVNQAIVSGEQFRQGWETTTRLSIARAAANPGDLDSALADYTQNFNQGIANARGLTPEQLAKAKEEGDLGRREIVHNAIFGAAKDGDPTGIATAQTILDNPKYAGLIGSERGQLQDHIKTMTKFGESQVRQKAEDNRRAMEDTSKANEAKVFGSFAQQDGTLRQPTAQDYAGVVQLVGSGQMSAAAGNAMHRMFDVMKSEDTAQHDDPATVLNLMKGIVNGTTTLDTIGKAATDKKITVRMLIELSNGLQKPSTDALKKIDADLIVKTQLGMANSIIRGKTPDSTIHAGLNQAVQQKMDQYKIDVYMKMRDAIIMGQDPRQFVDPNSKTYVNPELYKPSPEELKNEMVKRSVPGASGDAAVAKRSWNDLGL